jgi:two-component system, OmpR family, alkaline phosphatase synthesis response regulator PhoP
MPTEIMVAEDDPKLAEVLRRYLEREGYRVVLVPDGRQAIDRARRHPPDLIILDLMLPQVDGWDVCRVLKRESEVPILILTARSTQDDIVLGLDLGADDYVTKPFGPPELMARVRTVLRRRAVDAPSAPAPLRVGPLVIDQYRHEVAFDGRLVDCTPAEFRLLEVLAATPGRVYSRTQLLDYLHGMARFITERTIDGHIKNLRKKIEANPGQPQLLITVYGFGYKLDHPVAPPHAP